MGFSPVNIEIVANAREAIAQFQTVNGELGKMDAATLKAGGSISSMDKATRIGTAGLMAMGVAVAAIATISIKSAMESQVAFQKLGVALTNTGNSSDATRLQVSNLVDSQAKLGFSADQVASAYASMITATGSVRESTRLLGMAEDLARFKHIALGDAASILDKATQGSTRAFKELGISLDAHLPKNQAIALAFDQLKAKIGGEAIAYTKTFAGQLQILTAEGKNLADKIGTALMPILTTFLQWIKDSIDWLGKHKLVLVAIGTVVATYLSLAVVELTQKLYANAIAWAAANWQLTLIVAAVAAVGAGFVWLWNKFEPFRQGIVLIMKVAVEAVGYLIGAIGSLVTAWLNLTLGPVKLFLEVMSKLPIIGGFAKDALRIIGAGVNDVGNVFTSAKNNIIGFGQSLDGLANKKISFDLGGLLPAPTIPSVIGSSGGSAGVIGGVLGGNVLKNVKSTASNAMGSNAFTPSVPVTAAQYAANTSSASNTRSNFLSTIAAPTVTQNIVVNGSTAPADIATATVAAIKYGTIAGGTRARTGD